ncbi:MAG: EAL domain-containing protein, partial [Kangiellaceae bacterium]|nr:EAL domain-containing protein [Kangiellaceae bacterium]
LKYADSAMYQAKKSGKDNFQYYSQALHDEIVERIKLEDELSCAIKEKQFVLHYQPQVDIKTGIIVGVEALVRWQHPDKGLIYPDDFISLAEEVGLISNIGDWVFEESLEQINRWESAGIETVPISINISVNQLQYQGFIPYLKTKLAEKVVGANMITLEITESLSLGEQEKYLSILEQLKAIGFRISMDDFGTGYSNLTYLKRFPIDEIKIDKGFIDNITQNPHDKAIATTIIAIAHNLNFDVTAEGVETKAQLALLASYNCDTMQGYYFSQPKPAEEIGKLLQTKNRMSLHGVLPEGYQRTILIVDDEKEILLALKRSLRKTGAKVISAQNAEDALELLALNKVGVVLSDLSMPNTNGIELLDRVHQMYPNTLRMILSGQNEFELACDAINRSAIFRFITKPWSDDLLREEIKKAFKIYESTIFGSSLLEDPSD